MTPLLPSSAAPIRRKRESHTVNCLNNITHLIALCLTAAVISFVSASASDEGTESCRLYLGPSSLSTKDAPKLGVYSGVDVPPGSPIGPPDIAVQLIDVSKHHAGFGEGFGFVLNNFWTAGYTLGQFESDDVLTFVIGLGSLMQEHPSIANVQWDPQTSISQQSCQEQENDENDVHPGRGAYSTYNGVTFSARQFIPAGMELFVESDEMGPTDRNVNENGEILPNRFDHARADEILDNMLSFFAKHELALTEQSKRDIYEFLMNNVLDATSSDVEHGKNDPFGYTAMRSLFPQSPEKLQAIKDMGGTSLYYNDPRILVDQDWFDVHGSCIDNIKPQKSTIPHAGMGAFAKRSIKKGEVVTVVPLFSIANKNLLDMHLVIGSTDKGAESDYTTTSQLLLNYCFGHPRSSMLLLPVVTAGSFINHQSGTNSNVQLLWSKSRIHHSDWLQIPPEILLDDDRYRYPGLVLDVISTRDIEKGEEIFLNYGTDWDEAWAKHLESWAENATEDGWSFQSAKQWNQNYQSMPHPTDAERVIPAGIQRICTVLYENIPDDEVNRERMTLYQFVAQKKELNAYSGHNAYYCKILEVDKGTGEKDDVSQYTYRVSISEIVEGVIRDIIIKGVPHNAVRYVDSPYSSDQHNPDAFRHYISLSEDIWPEAWLDLVEEADAEAQ